MNDLLNETINMIEKKFYSSFNKDLKIDDLIKKDDKISTEQMSKILEVSTRTIKRHIKEMNNIKYIGSGYSGHWEIL